MIDNAGPWSQITLTIASGASDTGNIYDEEKYGQVVAQVAHLGARIWGVFCKDDWTTADLLLEGGLDGIAYIPLTDNANAPLGLENLPPTGGFLRAFPGEGVILGPMPFVRLRSVTAGSAGYKIGKIGTANAVVAAPAVAADELRIIAGDDYKNTDGRAITWTLQGVPDLTSATVTFTGAGITKATTATTDTVTLELDDTDTVDIEPDVYEFELAAALVGGAMITLVRGVMIVQ